MEWYELHYHRWTKGETRDSQRAKAYKAERRVFVAPSGLAHLSVKTASEITHQFRNARSVQSYVDRVCQKQWFKRRFGRMSVTVKVRPRTRCWAYGVARGPDHGVISLPGTNGRWARQRWVILHELAHCLNGREWGPGHGRRWARTYLCLIRYEVGKEAYEALRDSFRTCRVKFSPYRNITFEQRQRLRERGRELAAAAQRKTPTD